MSQVVIHKLAPCFMSQMYGVRGEQSKLAVVLLNKGAYVPITMEGFKGSADDIAEELFDLTNNPSRQEEREEKYGRGPSLSVGDVVQVGKEKLVCCSFGWQHI